MVLQVTQPLIRHDWNIIYLMGRIYAVKRWRLQAVMHNCAQLPQGPT